MNIIRKKEERLDLEQEESHGEYEKMKLVFEKKIDLYKRLLKKDNLTDIERLTLSNKKEWSVSNLLNLIIEKELHDRLEDLTRRVYKLEKVVDIE